MKKMISVLLCLAMVFALAIPAFAVDVETAGSTGTTNVNLTAEARAFKVTVPTAFNFYVDQDGVVTTPDPANIENLSTGPVIIKKIETSAVAPWHFVAGAYNADMTNHNIGSNDFVFGLTVGPWEMADTTSGAVPTLVDVAREGDPEGAVAIADDSSLKANAPIASTGHGDASLRPVSVAAQFAPVAETVENQRVANIVITVDWYTASHPFAA